MSNVFLTYAREDDAKAALIARALTGQGWTVWWDRTIPPGKTFVIEDALEKASCVVVLWSKAALASHWVRAEAAEGMLRGILIQAFLEEVTIPLEFRRIQATDLTAWDGGVGDPKFEQFLQSVTMLMQPRTRGPSPVAVAAPQAVEPSLDSFEREPLFLGPPACRSAGASRCGRLRSRLSRLRSREYWLGGSCRRRRRSPAAPNRHQSKKPRLRRPRNRASPRRKAMALVTCRCSLAKHSARHARNSNEWDW